MGSFGVQVRLVAQKIEACDPIAKRIEEIKQLGPKNDFRGLVKLDNLPRITIGDCEQCWQLIWTLIDLEDDTILKDINFMTEVYRCLDNTHNNKLSGGRTHLEMSSWWRWECDTTRLIYGFFLRQVGVSSWSNNIKVCRLKHHKEYVDQRRQRNVIDADDSALAALESMPKFPSEDEEEMATEPSENEQHVEEMHAVVPTAPLAPAPSAPVPAAPLSLAPATAPTIISDDEEHREAMPAAAGHARILCMISGTPGVDHVAHKKAITEMKGIRRKPASAILKRPSAAAALPSAADAALPSPKRIKTLADAKGTPPRRGCRSGPTGEARRHQEMYLGVHKRARRTGRSCVENRAVISEGRSAFSDRYKGWCPVPSYRQAIRV